MKISYVPKIHENHITFDNACSKKIIYLYYGCVKHNYAFKIHFQFKFTIGNSFFRSPAQFGFWHKGGFFVTTTICDLVYRKGAYVWKKVFEKTAIKEKQYIPSVSSYYFFLHIACGPTILKGTKCCFCLKYCSI